MSGGIAVLADDLGRRLGKKRLHVKGLRPKRVAQIGTFLAGIFVSLITIMIVSVASSGVRQWIIQGHNAIVERDKAQRELAAATKQRDAGKAELARMKNLRDTYQQSNQHLGEQISQQKGEITTGQAQLALLHTQIDRIKPEIARLKKAALTSQAEISHLHTEQAKAQKNLVTAQAKLSGLVAQLKDVNEKLAIARADTLKAYKDRAVAIQEKQFTDRQNQELILQRANLEKQLDTLKGEVASLERQKTDAEAAVAEADKRLMATQAQLAQTQNQLLTAQNQLREEQKVVSAFQGITAFSRYNPMIYKKGDEVARITVDPGVSFERAQGTLTSLLRAARVSAHQAGAAANGNYPEAGIFDHKDTRTGQDVRPEQIERELSEKVAGSNSSVVLVALSSLNAFKGEPVSLEIAIYPNPLVYKRDAVIAEEAIDGRKDIKTIFHELTALGAKIQGKAKQDKMIPRLGSDEPFGVVSSEDVLSLVNKVKASDRWIQVRAIVEDETYAADPLKIRFAVR